ncbi:hypothetical protein ONZ43_g5476 [Nemania bipapillata]|uniref:Uncharacterized protein n=1 Tax=Nemania bipapillata TaxID=110536 RepID=A0ACC2IA79_9PEZI|nr:hypothetical protein ONZ43_g5476 [Nemania bipapillata]
MKEMPSRAPRAFTRFLSTSSDMARKARGERGKRHIGGGTIVSLAPPLYLAQQAAVVAMLLLRPYASPRDDDGAVAVAGVIRICCLRENSHGRAMRASSAIV